MHSWFGVARPSRCEERGPASTKSMRGVVALRDYAPHQSIPWALGPKPSLSSYLPRTFPPDLPMVVYLNGQFVDKSKANLSVEDRGFVFGDGVYEVWRVVQGSLFESERHFDRLERGLRELRITPPAEATLERLEEIGARLLRDNDLL